MREKFITIPYSIYNALKIFFPWGYLLSHICLMLLSKWFCISWLTIKWLERERHIDSKSVIAYLEKINMKWNVGVQMAIMSDCLLQTIGWKFPNGAVQRWQVLITDKYRGFIWAEQEGIEWFLMACNSDILFKWSAL